MKNKNIIILFFIIVSLLIGKIDGGGIDKTKKLKEDIKKINKRIEELSKKEKDFSTEIEKLDYKILKSEKEIKIIQNSLFKLRKGIREQELKINSIEFEIKKKRKNLKRVIELMYENRDLKDIEIYFSGKDILTIMENINYLKIISDKIFNQYNEYKELVKRFKKEKEDLKTKEVRKKEILKKRKQTWTKFYNLKNEKENRVRKILNKKVEYLRVLNIKKRELQKLGVIIKSRKMIKTPYFSNLNSLQYFKGKLQWPVKGKVIERFGIKRHPKYNIKLKSNGIEIMPYKNDEKVRTIYDGVVVFSDYVRSYGDTIIIEHPGKYYTLYSHLKERFVFSGNRVKKGDIIGIVGKTGLREKKSLYFSLRKGVSPLNPLKWLKRKRRRR